MTKYVVIKDFKDLQDKNKVYEVNNPYPMPANKKVSEERIAELLGSNNKQGNPVIKEVKNSAESKK